MGYAFEITVSNSVRNQIQNVPGYFGTGTGEPLQGLSARQEHFVHAAALCLLRATKALLPQL